MLVAIAEMALAGGIGATVAPEWSDRYLDCNGLADQLFGEDQGRYLVTVADPLDFRVPGRAEQAGLECHRIGRVAGDRIAVAEKGYSDQPIAEISLTDLRAAHEDFFPKLMGADAALA